MLFRSVSQSRYRTSASGATQKAAFATNIAKLLPGRTYYIKVNSGAILAANATTHSFYDDLLRGGFQTGSDSTTPILNRTTSIPASGATNVDLNPTFILKFDENVKAAFPADNLQNNSSFKIYNSDGSLLGTEVLSTSDLVKYNTDNSLSFTINTALEYGKTYYLAIGTNAISDKNGVAYAGLTYNNNYFFTTKQDPNALVISSSNPVVPLVSGVTITSSSDITITFNKPISRGTGYIKICSSIASCYVFSETIAGNVLTLNPAANLPTNTNFYIFFDVGIPAYTTLENVPHRTAWLFSIMSLCNVIGGLIAGLIKKRRSAFRTMRATYFGWFVFSLPLYFTYPALS